MSDTETREVYVLVPFVGPDGEEIPRDSTITVAYATERQRRKVNSMVFRGFITFDVKGAKKHSRRS